MFNGVKKIINLKGNVRFFRGTKEYFFSCISNSVVILVVKYLALKNFSFWKYPTYTLFG